MTSTHSPGSEWWSDSRGIGHLVCAGLLWVGIARDVTWTNNHREHKLVRAILVLQRFDIADRNLHLFTRKDVGDRLSEDIWTFLVEQTCNLATRLSGIVNSLGFFARKNLAAHCPVADDHGHIVDGCILRQRKGVDRLDLFLEGILKLLSYDDA